MSLWTLPPDLAGAVAEMARHLDPRSAWRLAALVAGHLHARGRRTVTSWLRGAGLGVPGVDPWRPYYAFLGTLAGKVPALAAALLAIVLERVAALGSGTRPRLRFALDDTNTPRYGPFVQGAGIHRNPTPGPAGAKHVYGHVWVVLALLARHSRWGVVALPLRAMLYIRKITLAAMPERGRPEFRTKLQQAAELLNWLAGWAKPLGFRVELVADGAFATRRLLDTARRLGMTVVSRLRRNAALRTVPVRTGKRGRPRKYGAERISLAKRAGQRRGWTDVACTLYGRPTVKRVKVFQATWRPADGLILVVLTKEADGSWRAFFTTDLEKTAAEVLEAVADRGAIEQCFHGLKEVLGAAQQQLRRLDRNIGAFHLNAWTYTLSWWWSWLRPDRELVDRRASGWDRPERRPSAADLRRAQRREMLENNIKQLPPAARRSRKCRRLLEQLAAATP